MFVGVGLATRRMGGAKLIFRPAAIRPIFRLMATAANDDVEITDDGLVDGSKTFLHQESRNLCRCIQCCSQYSMAKTMVSVNAKTKLTKILGVDDDFISAKWSDGHTGKIPRNTLAAYGEGAGAIILEQYMDLVQRKNRAQTFWTGENGGAAALAHFQYSAVKEDSGELLKFFLHFMEYGIAVLKGCPHLHTPVSLVTKDLRYGPVKHNLYGTATEVVYKSANDKEFVAFTNSEIVTHTDSSFYTRPSEILSVYGKINTVVGGDSTYVDTFAVMNEVRHEEPEFFKTLTEVPAIFRYGVPQDILNFARHNVVEMRGEDIYRVVDTFFTLDEFDFAKNVDLETRKRWWEAYSYYRNKVREPRVPAAERIETGDLVIIDNSRILHGRKQFEDGPGERVLNLMYTEFSHLIPKIVDLHMETHDGLEVGDSGLDDLYNRNMAGFYKHKTWSEPVKM